MPKKMPETVKAENGTWYINPAVMYQRAAKVYREAAKLAVKANGPNATSADRKAFARVAMTCEGVTAETVFAAEHVYQENHGYNVGR